MRISVEGTKGSGKTELLKLLHAIHYHVHHTNLKEYNLWNNLHNSNLNRYSFSYNLFVLLEKINQSHHPDEIHLFENSPYTLQQVWSQMLLKKKLIHEEEFKLQEEIIDKWCWTPDCIIYLDCDPEICYERLKKNSSNEEINKLDINELKEQSQQYDWVLDYSNCNIPVYRVNASDNIINVFYHVLQILYQIKRHNLGLNPNYKGKEKGVGAGSTYFSSKNRNKVNKVREDSININSKSPLYSLLLKKTQLLEKIL